MKDNKGIGVFRTRSLTSPRTNQGTRSGSRRLDHGRAARPPLAGGSVRPGRRHTTASKRMRWIRNRTPRSDPKIKKDSMRDKKKKRKKKRGQAREGNGIDRVRTFLAKAGVASRGERRKGRRERRRLALRFAISLRWGLLLLLDLASCRRKEGKSEA